MTDYATDLERERRYVQAAANAGARLYEGDWSGTRLAEWVTKWTATLVEDFAGDEIEVPISAVRAFVEAIAENSQRYIAGEGYVVPS